LDDLPFGEEGGDFCTCLMLSRENEVCIWLIGALLVYSVNELLADCLSFETFY
jgi:hypothetical protein